MRAESFQTRSVTPHSPLSENGDAFTAAISWTPTDWLRITGELIDATSTRGDRILDSLDPHQSQTQLQLNTRFFL